MISFYDFPNEHWVHLRTTNIVESPFDMIRLRTNAARRFKRVENATSIIWKLLMIGERHGDPLKDLNSSVMFITERDLSMGSFPGNRNTLQPDSESEIG